MKKKLAILLTLLLVFGVVASSFATATPTYEEQLQAQMDTYGAMSESVLMATAKTLFAEDLSGGDGLIPIASALYERREALGIETIVAEILDDTNPEFLRVTYVQILAELTEYSYSTPQLLTLLNHTAAPSGLRTAIVTNLGFPGGIGVDVLEDLVAETDGVLAFHALKQINRADAQKAYTMAKVILSDYENQMDEKVMAATKVFAQAYSKSHSETAPALLSEGDKTLLFTVAQEVIENTENPVMRDSLVFSVADMCTPEAVKLILDCSNADDILQKTTVDRNCKTLIELLEEPSAQDLAFVGQCMQILPIKELAQPLRAAMAKVPAVYGANTTALLDVLALIETQGADANPKWEN